MQYVYTKSRLIAFRFQAEITQVSITTLPDTVAMTEKKKARQLDVAKKCQVRLVTTLLMEQL